LKERAYLMISILYRNICEWKNEEDYANKHFNTIHSRTLVKSGDLIIPRYSALPFYKELQEDIEYNGARLIDTYNQFAYISDLGNWYYDLKDFTPQTWTELYALPENKKFILKGETNSKKFNFDTHMFAASKKDAITVHGRLLEDSLIQDQKIYIREFVDLETFETGLRGLPITREYRFFIYKDKILSGGYYWSSHYDTLIEQGEHIDHKEVPLDFLRTVINKIQNTSVSEPPVFYVIDVAKTAKKDWIVIELNSGAMSGLSMNDPGILYANLKRYTLEDNV
jgi:hypothetical protein